MRYFFQWMILITMALSLVACSGSSGSDGATGATGADGADGTIAVPDADSDLAITASTTPDSNLSLGSITREYELSGADNLTADSRVRYYMYEGTSATSKAMYWSVATTPDNLQDNTQRSNGVLDTRLKTGDNHTLNVGNDFFLIESELLQVLTTLNSESYGWTELFQNKKYWLKVKGLLRFLLNGQLNSAELRSRRIMKEINQFSRRINK